MIENNCLNVHWNPRQKMQLNPNGPISVTLGSTEETHSDGKQKYDFSSVMANFSHSVRKIINAEGPTPACNPCLKQGL